MDRFTCTLAAGVLVLVIGGLATAAWLRGHASAPELTTPGGVVLAYAEAEQRGDGTAAWNLLDAAVQARNDRDTFVARTPREEDAYLAVEDEHVDADTATVVLVRMAPGSGGVFERTYASHTPVRLRRTGSDWRIVVPPDSYRLTPLAK